MIGPFKKFLHPRNSRGLRDSIRSPGEDQLTPRNADRNSTTPSEFCTTADDESSDSSCQSHWDLALQLRPSFPTACSWLEPSDLQDIGEPAVDGGRFAEVRRGHLGDRKVAVKSYRRYIHFDCDRVRMRFLKEAHAYDRLSHRNIVPFVGVYSTLEYPFSLVFEFMEHLNLTEYVRTEPNARKLELVAGTARGLHYMHALDIVHGNLEITNVLVDSEGTPRIGGLGSAIFKSPVVAWPEEPDTLTRSSAPEFVHPEAFGLPNTQPTKAGDVYAFGVLAYQVFAGSGMFPNLRDEAAAFAMLEGSRPPRPDDAQLSDRVWDIINSCWEKTPSQRITIADAVSILETELRQARYTSHSLHPLTLP